MPHPLRSRILMGLAGILCLTLWLDSSSAGRFRHGRRGLRDRANRVAPVIQTDRKAPHPRAKSLLRNWRVAEAGMFDQHGTVTAANGMIVMPEGNPATGIAYKPPVPRIDYEVKLEAKRTAGNDFFCGLTFPINKEYCSLILGGWGGTTVGLSNIDSQSANENESTTFIDFERDRWYRIRLRVTTARIDVWIDGDLAIGLKTDNHTFDIWWEQDPIRPLGIATWNTAAAVRKFEIIHGPDFQKN